MTVTMVAAVARNGVIGRDGALPWHLPGEQRRFKDTTMGHVLVMGRRTYESIGRPLPGRTTVVVSRRPHWEPAGGLPEGVLVRTSVTDALAAAREIDEQVYVVGGREIYSEALAYADVLLITEVDAEPEGDTHFPSVDWENWKEVSRKPCDGWTLATYARRQRQEGYREPHGNSV